MKSAAPKNRRVPRVQIDFSNTHSKTKQAFKEECDINNIVAKFMRTGVIDHVSRSQVRYGDYTYVTENHYQESLNTVLSAQNAFAQLPAKIRDRFSNDPTEFLKFVADSKNKKEAQELGLIAPDPAPAPAPAPEPQTPPKPKAE